MRWTHRWMTCVMGLCLTSLVLAAGVQAQAGERTTVVIEDDAADAASPHHEIGQVTVWEDRASTRLVVNTSLGLGDPLPPEWEFKLRLDGDFHVFHPATPPVGQATCQAEVCKVDGVTVTLVVPSAQLGGLDAGDTIEVWVGTFQGALVDMAPGPGAGTALADALQGEVDGATYTVLGPAPGYGPGPTSQAVDDGPDSNHSSDQAPTSPTPGWGTGTTLAGLVVATAAVAGWRRRHG